MGNPEATIAEREVIASLAEELRDVVEQRAALERRIVELRQLIGQLEDRIGIDDAESVLESIATTRVGAVEGILRAADGPITLGRIDEVLHEQGIPETRKNIASALSYLGTNDRAHRVGRGLWQHGPDPSGG